MFYELSNYVNIFWLSIIIKFQFSLKKASKNVLISCNKISIFVKKSEQKRSDFMYFFKWHGCLGNSDADDCQYDHIVFFHSGYATQ